MGQRFSSRVVSALDRGLERARQQMDDNMRQSIKKNKYGFSDPNAAIGFTRGMDKVDPRQKDVTSQDLECNPDLIKFLQDMTPIQKELNQEFTSSRLLKQTGLDSNKEASSSFDSQLKENPEVSSAISFADTRSVRSMPLFGEEMDFVTQRTTNFSKTTTTPEDGKFRITPIELFQYKRTGENVILPQNPSDMSEQEQQEKQEQHQELLERALHYMEVPTILKDNDNDLLGVFHNISVDPVLESVFRPASGVTFLMEYNSVASLEGMSSKSSSQAPETNVAKSMA